MSAGDVGRPGDKVRFKGQSRGNLYVGRNLEINQSRNWGLTVDSIYTVGEVVEDYKGNPIYVLAGRNTVVDASCFELVD